MLHQAKIRVAFVSSTGERVDIGLEDKGKILIYEIAARDAKLVMTHTFRGTAKGNKRGRPKSTLCNTSKSLHANSEAPGAEVELMKERYAALMSTSVLVVYQSLSTTSVLALQDAQIYPIKVEEKEFIGVVIQRLQQLLQENRLLWVRRAIDRTIAHNLHMQSTQQET
jgi:hypothetical protein